MWQILLVACGGAIGSVARFELSTWAVAACAGWRLPIGTLAVNALGCFVAGVLTALSLERGIISADAGDARAFLFVGVLGGFTTFSAFGLDTFLLLRNGAYAVAAANVAGNVALGLACVALGFAAAR